MKLIFATGNPYKVSEVAKMLEGNSSFEVISMKDLEIEEDIPETSPTIEGNALQKARYLYEKYNLNCFSEDTGLEIESLDGEPGVFSARYAGPERSAEANMELVLKKLRGKTNRRAQFRTVIALIIDGKENTFEGIVTGRIAEQKAGTGGFGYDPIFVPDGYDRSFGELDASVKNQISHRARALSKLIDFPKTHEPA